jgi:glycosyltransferase involved in cell wall biosynthesis
MNTHLITVFTPTFNRKELLSKLYIDLQNQTFKDFLWLIIDDGSTDGTNEIVQEWINANIIDIQYIHKENGGKHKAFQLAYQICETKYITDFDDDDIYFSNCLETFIKCWEEIEQQGLTDIGAIRALTVDSQGKVVGLPNFKKQQKYKDISYIDYQLIQGVKLENVSCIKMEAYRQCNFFYFDDTFLGKKVSFVYEDIFWARFGTKYKSRYLFEPVREYNYSPVSITRGKANKKNSWISKAYSSTLMFNEFGYLYLKCFISFFKRHVLYLTYILSADLKFKDGVKALKSRYIRLFSYILYPLSKTLSIYLTHFKYKI